ncbi:MULTISPECIES: hypothetical protein [unclassified Nostoc]|uniref:hypothetical protein n=1 Tax=unclassified Nostoc TaxID=2593658 RepID=UPI002AD49742|nr:MULTISPECIES: hypothetical protein [unclassified Nostoc]MDZ8093759.1 hypothetical protein [Nostoc sp. DedQUE05]MDZ8131385.1 hypothetical protein [Nostoc sp. DedQUE07]
MADFFIFYDRFPDISFLYHEFAIADGQNLITAEIMYLTIYVVGAQSLAPLPRGLFS